jgi:hypothetical protein
MVNEYFHLIDYGGTIYYYLFEFANFSFLSLFALYIYKIQLINLNSLLGWIAIFFSPLVFNYLLFSPYLFGDQFLYSGEAYLLKTNGESNLQSHQIDFVSKILSSIPLPNFMTVTSLAFSNKLLLFLTFLWLKRYFNDENKILLIFFIPSLIIYSSLALRDTLIIIFSILFLIYLLRDRYLIALIFLYPIFILKIQMFSFLGVYFIGRLIFRAHKSYFLTGFFVSFILIISFVFADEILAIVNLYRLAFVMENFIVDGGGSSYAAFSIYGSEIEESLKISSMQEAIFISIINLPKFLLLPMPWNWSTPFHFFQTLESIFLIYIFFYLAMKDQNYKNIEFIFLCVVLVMSCMLYSIIMDNEGTFVRYRFTLFYPFLMASIYIHETKKYFSKT